MARTPYNWTPAKHHLTAINNPARFKTIIWHRKAWKTTLAINELMRWANAIKGTYWFVTPLLNQAKKIVWQDPEMLAKYCPPEIWEKRNNTEMYIPFPNGSILYILGADNPDGLRGPNPKGVVLDEYDDMKPEIWSTIIQPIMTANPDAWTWFMGTPKGRRDLFNKYTHSLRMMEEAKEKGTRSQWFGTLLRASESGIISKEALLEVKNDPNTPESFYQQEYECAFIDGAGAFFRNIDQCIHNERPVPEKGKRYNLGVDWAKINDFTVLTPFDLTTFKAARQERFNQIDYNLQKAKAEASHLWWNKAYMRMDSTGVGEPLYDDLSLRIRNIEAYTFTEQSRRDLLVNLQILIERGKIKIPNDETLLNELRSFQYMLTPLGKVKIGVPNNGHDDCVMSLALAVWNIPQEPINHLYDEEKEILKQFDSRKRKGGKKKVFDRSVG